MHFSPYNVFTLKDALTAFFLKEAANRDDGGTFHVCFQDFKRPQYCVRIKKGY